ncbi:MAG: hypothetical protein ABEJ69_03305 [Candidatus Nanohaloarchaea archaeon]
MEMVEKAGSSCAVCGAEISPDQETVDSMEGPVHSVCMGKLF